MRLSRAVLPLLLAFLMSCSSQDNGGQGGDGGQGGENGDGPCDRVDASCPAASEFFPCGGNPTGRWTWESSCRLFTVNSPVFEGCESGLQEVQITYFGETTFLDGIRHDRLTGSSVRNWDIPGACIEAVNPETTVTLFCADLTGLIGEWETGETIGRQLCEPCADGCACHSEYDPMPVGSADAPFVVDGTEIVVGDWRQEFCVQGDVLTLREQHQGDVLVATLRRTVPD